MHARSVPRNAHPVQATLKCYGLHPVKRFDSLWVFIREDRETSFGDKFVQEIDLKWNSGADLTSINNSCKGSPELLSSEFYSWSGASRGSSCIRAKVV
jgi:hypothetical protein